MKGKMLNEIISKEENMGVVTLHVNKGQRIGDLIIKAAEIIRNTTVPVVEFTFNGRLVRINRHNYNDEAALNRILLDAVSLRSFNAPVHIQVDSVYKVSEVFTFRPKESDPLTELKDFISGKKEVLCDASRLPTDMKAYTVHEMIT